MLSDSFYTVQSFESIENKIIAEIQLNAQHPIFEGHFPKNPITPGVVQMEIVKELISKAIYKKVGLKSMSSCKFLAILNPNEHPIVQINIQLSDSENGEKKANAVIQNEEITFFKMNGVYK